MYEIREPKEKQFVETMYRRLISAYDIDDEIDKIMAENIAVTLMKVERLINTQKDDIRGYGMLIDLLSCQIKELFGETDAETSGDDNSEETDNG